MNVNVIDQLVMKTESNKALLKAICKQYDATEVKETPFVADLIKGKGEGQVILLHGPPGTGKTLTAESVAEFTKRPLLAITAADLGHQPAMLEKSLLTFFRDANEWGAIVLLDEADVYLERRSIQDLTRNSIVSIFLRALDYFKGILFLTSNRVGSFDEAFMSRIHVQIGYDPLDEDARRNIWNNYFRKLQQDFEEGGREIRYEWDAKEYVQRSQEVRDLEWNGREIRNAFQTAVTLALDETKQGSVPVVKESHLRQVVKMSKSFKDYIRSTHGNMDDADMAYDSGLRNDTIIKHDN
ncbi:ATPase family AAA domain-containing protein 3B [Lachnellula suecica]|uniref:ATPase family AAA domain-containing protein 3B n=1 Tax=Lachnellula suecica TaxID=602035 RepID=A0A8T9C9G5_9HELO|nr:ATPase family AAA domain-containing protein 3B [Lachnellula suecica]